MEDLTIPNWIALARRLGKSKKMWKRFLGFMYMGLDVEDDSNLVDDFGVQVEEIGVVDGRRPQLVFDGQGAF
ncbi:hypothetical protein FRC15_004819 [Serendipita sp. 397]|nr:hypothetical protein FRC15_004819 [Serendipita sp. 397]